MAPSSDASKPQPLYHSPWGLLPFQQDGVIRACVGNLLAAWDTGLGKTHLGLASAALLFEDDEIDVCLLICEQNKIDEWVLDLEKFTRLRAIPYGGPKMTKDHRRLIMQAVATGERVKIKRGWEIEKPQVLVGTYETFRNDLMAKVKAPNAKGRMVESLVPGPLAQALSGRRLLLTYDEMTKVGNRGNDMHKAQAVFLKHLAKTGGTARMLGLTATPIERDPENYYNLGRLLCPEAVGTVKSFETDYVKYRDAYDRATFKNLTPDTLTEPWVTPLSVKMAPVLHRKRWTDDDVRTQFPEVGAEKFVHVRLGDKHQEFYETVRDFFAEEEDPRPVFTLMRMIAGHPLSLLHSDGPYARAIVDEVGEAGLTALGSAKLDALVERLKPLVLGQGSQAVVFTFFGPSMIPLIAQRLEDEGISVALNYPAIGDAVRRQHKADFQDGTRRVFLSSDAGARGINLPQAAYAFEYDMALTHANRTQRLNRVKRLNSRDYGVERIYFQSLIALDTVEDGIAQGVMKRNAWADALLDDEDTGEHFISAAHRKSLLEISRRSA